MNDLFSPSSLNDIDRVGIRNAIVVLKSPDYRVNYYDDEWHGSKSVLNIC